MLLLKPILAGILGIAMASAAMAEPTIRPFARSDAVALQQAQADRALAAFRAKPRPAHMIRYPIAIETREPAVRPSARAGFLPRTRWEHKDGNAVWTRAAMTAIGGFGDGLDSLVPRDIDSWCPAYTQNTTDQRQAFWVGLMSALAKHESTYNPRAVGGGDLWFGLLQIYPDTARRYGCRAQTGDALKNPTENLSCAARIMNVTVRRDNAIAVRDGRWRGIAADWGPMSNRSKIAEMSAWTRKQSYCEIRELMRPQVRPAAMSATFSAINVVMSE